MPKFRREAVVEAWQITKATAVSMAHAQPGDWIVVYPATGETLVVSDHNFRSLFTPIDDEAYAALEAQE